MTGGSRGVGAATALMLAEAGADVVIGFRSQQNAADKIVGKVQSYGVRGSAIAADISTKAGAAQLFGKATGFLGGLDIFVGNAGIWPWEVVPVSQMSDDRWHETMRQNLDSIFFTSRQAAAEMKKDGRIVLISSTAGQRGESFHADYAATKGAVIAFTKSLAIELAATGTTVNCVAPGWIDTDMVDSVRENGSLEKIAASIPIQRVASTRDIAGPVVFLCSDLARHITGEILNVNGGSVLCG